MKVTTLIENRRSETDRNLVAEWGLSLHIEFNGHHILFDTGTSGAFAKNAEYLSIDIGSVETTVLSHHHLDHGGGLRRFFELNPNAKVHLGKAPGGDCFFRIPGFLKKYIGLDRNLIANFAGRFVPVDHVTQILPNVFVLPHIVGSHPKPVGNKNIYVKKTGSFVLDDFTHEVIMAIRESDKLVVFTGCSHSGILNAIDTVAREFRGVPIKAVVGGFHLVSIMPFLMAGKKHQVEDIGKAILNYPIDKTYTGHCTGSKAFRVLKSVVGEHLVDIRIGSCFEV